MEVGIVENFETTYACSPSVLSGSFSGAHRAFAAGTWTAFGLGLGRQGGTRVVAPFSAEIQGTGLSSAMRDKTAAPATATALLPISDVVVYDVLAGIRSWSPPV